MEIWKTYPHDERYEVSSEGRVRMIGGEVRKTKRASQMKYHAMNFFFDGKLVTRYVHEMVLTTFRGPRPPSFDSSHLDGNVDNNALDNLVWESRAENLARRKGVKLTPDDVIAIRAGHDLKTIAAMRGVRVDSLYKVRRGDRWAHIGPRDREAALIGSHNDRDIRDHYRSDALAMAE